MFNNSKVTETMIKLPYLQKNTKEKKRMAPKLRMAVWTQKLP
jgi:hypothetical protein